MKFLKSKNVKIKIYAEIENGQLVAQQASSEDIRKIDRHIIERVRFQFITKSGFGRMSTMNTDTSVDQLHADHPLFESGQELLDEALKHIHFRHHRHLRYLADQHAGHLLKIRYVLQPFSFVFLLEGASQFHIILETLDIEEASYLWHLPKVRSDLPLMLKAIDGHLDILRKRDRQEFLTSAPENFSRIIHDYTDSQKGFIDIKTATPEAIGMADSFAQKTPCSNP